MDILNPGQPLRTAAPVVQVVSTLQPGAYDVEVVVTDAQGVQASARLSFQIQRRIVVGPGPGPGPIDPPIRPPVDPPVTPPIRPPIRRPRGGGGGPGNDPNA